MQLIAHATARADRVDGRAFVPERVGVFEPAEFAPGKVEFAGHAEEIHIAGLGNISGRFWEVIVAPAAGRERFEFQMAVEIHHETLVAGNVAAVVENGHVRVVDFRGGDGLLIIIEEHLVGVAAAVFALERIVPFFRHARHAPGAAAFALADDVQPYPVIFREERGGFLDLTAEIVKVWRIEAHGEKPGVERAPAPAHPAAVFVDLAPVGVEFIDGIIDTGGEIDLRLHIDLFIRLVLRAEEVKFEMRVHDADLRRVIREPVVAFGKAGYGIDVACLEGALPFGLIKSLADAWDVRRGMEIEMDLTKAERFVFHREVVWQEAVKQARGKRKNCEAKKECRGRRPLPGLGGAHER